MTKQNPFYITFGKEPNEYIRRINEFNNIVETFISPQPYTNSFIISGVRGSGKTVLLTSLYNYFNNEKKCIVVDLNTRRDMLEDLAANIYEKGKVKFAFIEKEFSFSFHGLSLTLGGKNPIKNVSVLLNRMFEILKKQGVKVIITVDDIDKGENLKVFIKEFQSLYRKDFPIFFIATGLYDAVESLEKQSGLTFIARCPKIYLAPLSLKYIEKSYKSIFEISDEMANRLANLTNGYAYAYQLVGYLFYKSETKTIDESFLNEYDFYLEESVYNLVYESLSPKEKEVIKAICLDNCNTNRLLLQKGVLTSNNISTYKERLSRRGICDNSSRGEIKIILPRFKEYIEYRK